MQEFGLVADPDLRPILSLTDNLNAPIPTKNFEVILRTFHKGSLYFVDFKLESTDIKGALQMVTPTV